VHHQPPVAQLVAEALDQEGAVVGQVPRRSLLLGEVCLQVRRAPLVEPRRAGPLQPGLRRRGADLAQEGAQGPAELQRAARGVAVPERHLARLARRGGDEDAVVRDVLDPPGRGTEQEDVADAGLVDHLLVELADAATAGALGADEEDAEEAAVGDGATAGDGQPLSAGPRGEGVGDAVPRQPRPQLGERVGGIAARQHVEHGVQRRVGQRGEGGRPADDGGHLVDGARPFGHDRDDLLREHVERIAQVADGLDRPGLHPLGDQRALHEVTAVLGEQHPPADGPHLVTGAAHPLEAGRDGRRRLDLHHEVDRAHVDAELEARRRDDRGQAAGFQRLLHYGPLFPGHRAVVGGGDRLDALGHPTTRAGLGHQRRGVGARWHRLAGGPLVGELVEPTGQPLGQPAGVGEHDGAAVGLDQVEDPLLDRRPDRRTRLVARRRTLQLTGRLAQLAHVLDGDDDREVPPLGGRRGHHLHGSSAGQIGGDLLDRAHRRGEADPLRRTVQQLVEPVERDGEVGAALGVGHRVHLVDDHRLHAAQRLASGAGQEEEERFGRGDEDVGGPPGEGAPLVGRGVAGADGHPDLGPVEAQPCGRLPDPGQGRPQVALDVDGQGLERRDVEDAAAALLLVRGWDGGQPVERPEEGREGLARTGGGDDEGVLAAADRVPGALLRRGGLHEGTGEPGPGGLREPVESGHGDECPREV
jgi:hypothetical protein